LKKDLTIAGRYVFSRALLSKQAVGGCILLVYRQYKDINPLAPT